MTTKKTEESAAVLPYGQAKKVEAAPAPVPAAPTPATVKLYILWWQVEGASTASVFSAFTAKDACKQRADEVRGSGGYNASQRSAKFFIQELDVLEVL